MLTVREMGSAQLNGDVGKRAVIARSAVTAAQHAARDRDGSGADQAMEVIRAPVVAFGEARLRGSVPAYASDKWYERVQSSTAAIIADIKTSRMTWADAASAFSGADVVQCLTIHKSKGLEYESVFFVGLEDSSWWAFDQDPDENTRAFFVAF